jgi:hypothetical protein
MHPRRCNDTNGNGKEDVIFATFDVKESIQISYENEVREIPIIIKANFLIEFI